MYRRFYHSKRRYVLWAMVVILFQALVFLAYPRLATALEKVIFRTEVPFPVFMPLYFTVGYGIASRHAGMSAWVGLVSWWAAPLVQMLRGNGEVVGNALVATVADGIIYGVVGLLAAYLTNLFTRKKVARP